MEFPPFASLGHVRILLIPVGNIRKKSYDKWASLIRSFESIRLGDIPPDGREDRARFMPSPLSTGHLHLSFPSHPPPAWHAPLALLRPSDFPLGVVGIADCSVSSTSSSVLAQFNAVMSHLFPPNSPFPLAQNCYIFEDGNGSTPLNLGDTLPGLVFIPSVMGNKELYVGTLLAELCSNIIGEFSNLARTIESNTGIESLNSSLFPSVAGFSDQRNPYDTSSSRRSLSSSPAGSVSNVQSEIGYPRSLTPSGKRVSTSEHSRPQPNRNSSLATAVTSKSAKRQSGLSVPQTGRLFKVLGDLFLIAGRSADAGVWYNQSLLSLSKSSYDPVWQASALEGLCTVQILEAWSAGHGLHSSFSTEGKEPWADIAEKLEQAAALYSRATSSPQSPMPGLESSLIVLLYTTCVCRQSSFLFSIWASKGWGPLAFTTMIRPGLPPTFMPRPPIEAHRFRMSAITRISRGQIASILTQAHGPFLLHLEPHDRIRLLQYTATMYSCLGFRRKEVYALRELLSAVMDVLVCGRDEVIRVARERGSGLANAGSALGIVDAGSVSKSGAVGVRETESMEGNESIIALVKYVCEVYGVDLGAIKIVGPDAQGGVEVGVDDDMAEERKLRYGWNELQLGVVREAVAIVEALPDYPTVAQFDLAALRTLHTIINPSDQAFLYTNSVKALMTARRRGDDRRVEYWSGNPVVSIEISPLPFVRLPVEHPGRDLHPAGVEPDVVVGRRDPFIYNPRLLAKSKAEAIVVQNEPLEFVLTLQNPYAFDLELQSLTLSTFGVPLQIQPLVITVPANSYQNSYHIVRIIGTPLQSGKLYIRGCIVQMQGGISREFILPLATQEEESKREKRKSAWNSEIERIKAAGLDARPWIRDITRLSMVKGKTIKRGSELRFLECNVVPQQPLMRIRRTSLTHGAVMMYDGETSIIRITVENVSLIPIEFIRLTFEDSTVGPAQQALSDGEMSVFDTYETEYQLLRRPVFGWDPEKEPRTVGPGKKVTLSVTCSGKVGCTSGVIQISYSHVQRELISPLDTFYTRQILYPVLVTVYNTLECNGMDILPFSSMDAISGLYESGDPDEQWKQSLEVTGEEGEWCLFTVDVRNTYGMPFEVAFERDQEASSTDTVTRLVAPGSTSRIILPIKRFVLPESLTSEPIPTLSDRQFVVSKSNLTSREERHQRELFWYREELFKLVKGRWRETGGSRHGFLSLRQQRLTAPMLDTLRIESTRVRLALVGYTDEDDVQSNIISRGSRTTIRPNEFIYLRVTLINLSPIPQMLTVSLTMSPSEHVLSDGVLNDIPVGKLNSGGERQVEFGVCFISEGRFELRAVTRVVDANPGEDPKIGEGDLKVLVRSES